MAKSSTVSKSSKTKKTNSKTRIRISVSQSKAPPKKRKQTSKSSASSSKNPKTKSPNGQAIDIESLLTALGIFEKSQPLLILTWQRSPLVAPLTTTTSSTMSLMISSTASRPMGRSGKHFLFQQKSSCPMALSPTPPCL